jgi:hypothetical protein
MPVTNVDEGSEYDPEPDLEQVTKKLADLRKQRRKTNLTPKQRARLDEDIEIVESHEEVLRQRAKELSHPEMQTAPKKKPGRPPKKVPAPRKKKAPSKRKPKVVPESSESESESESEEEESDSEIQISDGDESEEEPSPPRTRGRQRRAAPTKTRKKKPVEEQETQAAAVTTVVTEAASTVVETETEPGGSWYINDQGKREEAGCIIV